MCMSTTTSRKSGPKRVGDVHSNPCRAGIDRVCEPYRWHIARPHLQTSGTKRNMMYARKLHAISNPTQFGPNSTACGGDIDRIGAPPSATVLVLCATYPGNLHRSRPGATNTTKCSGTVGTMGFQVQQNKVRVELVNLGLSVIAWRRSLSGCRLIGNLLVPRNLPLLLSGHRRHGNAHQRRFPDLRRGVVNGGYPPSTSTPATTRCCSTSALES